MNRSSCFTLGSSVALVAATSFSLFACETDGGASDPPPIDEPPIVVDGGDAPAVTCVRPTGEPTIHQGDVGEDEVWTAAESPHVVEYDVNVRGGHKLTIEPCAEVLLKKGRHIHVAYPGTPNIGGTLLAEGTASTPIRFAGFEGENWASLYVHTPGTARLAYVTLEDGGGGDFEDGATIDVLGDSVLPADPALFVDHVTVKGSTGTGVWMQRGSTFIAGSRDLTITGSGNDEHPFPMQLEEHAIDALPSGTYTGNRIDELLLRTSGMGIAGSGLTVDATLHDRGVPYRMGLSRADNFIVGPTGGGPAATLTIEAGVVMRFAKETAFRVQTFISEEPAAAAVRALGTADRPIVFTSAADTPAPGDWRGFWFGGIPLDTNVLDHVRIEYAGYDCSCSLATCSALADHDAAVVFTGQVPRPFITNTVFKDIGGHAVLQGFTGEFVNLRPTNTFDSVAGCAQTQPRPREGTCPEPRPTCDGG